MSGISLEIDSIIMNDLEISPDRAGRIRNLVEMELQRLLEREGLPNGGVSGRISNIGTPILQLTDLRSDSSLANSIALRIVRALQGNL